MDLYEKGLADGHKLADLESGADLRKGIAQQQREKITRADEEIARAQASKSYAQGVLFGMQEPLTDKEN